MRTSSTRTDDRVKDLRLEHLARDGEFAELQADGGVVRVLNVEAVEPEDGLCKTRTVSRSEWQREVSLRTIVFGGTVVGELVSLGESVDEGRHRCRLEVHWVVLQAAGANGQYISDERRTNRHAEAKTVATYIRLSNSSNLRSTNKLPVFAPLRTHISAISSSES